MLLLQMYIIITKYVSKCNQLLGYVVFFNAFINVVSYLVRRSEVKNINKKVD